MLRKPPEDTTRKTIFILQADDRREMLQRMSDILHLEDDFTIIGNARNGHEAVALALRLKPDVILMNYSMPGMNGVEATRRIKQLMPYAAVIMLSVQDSPTLIEAAFEAGVFAFFLKPVMVFEELYDAIRAAYVQNRNRAAARP